MFKKDSIIKFFLISLIIYIFIFVLIQTRTIETYYITILNNAMINVVLAVSLNMIIGFLGQLALGHAGFMAIGAYTSAIVTTYLKLPLVFLFPISFILSGLLSSLAAAIVGVPALRLKGDYLAIITLGFSEIIRNIIINLKITKGSRGFKNIMPYVGNTRGNAEFKLYVNFTVIFVCTVLTVFFISNLIKTRHGRAIKSINEDEIASSATGINTTYYKIFAFSFGAFFAGIAGALYAHNINLLNPNIFSIDKSIEIAILVILGGMGSIPGSIIAAILLTFLQESLTAYAEFRMLIYSLLLICIMIIKTKAPGLLDFKKLLKKEVGD